MLDISKDIHSLSDFKRNTNTFIKRMHQSGHPVVLTINGKAELVVQNASGYQELLERLDYLSAREGIKRGMEDVKSGRSRPAKNVFTEFRKKHGLSG